MSRNEATTGARLDGSLDASGDAESAPSAPTPSTGPSTGTSTGPREGKVELELAPRDGARGRCSGTFVTPPTGFLTSGDLARACHTTVRTVRFYEEAELVEPLQRSDGGHRLYEPDQVRRLQLIIDLREAGLSLQDIKDLFSLKTQVPSSAEASERMAAMLSARIDEMQAKIQCLRRLREELAAMVSILRECGSCDDQQFPKSCRGCDVMGRPDLPRAMRLLWGES